MKYFEEDTWQRWIDIVEGPVSLRDVLYEDTPRKYRLLVALALSCAKWHPMRNKRGSLFSKDCGLCNIYWSQWMCEGCPYKLYLHGRRCFDQMIWKTWAVVEKQDWRPYEARMLAEPIFRQLLAIYREEYERVIG